MKKIFFIIYVIYIFINNLAIADNSKEIIFAIEKIFENPVILENSNNTNAVLFKYDKKKFSELNNSEIADIQKDNVEKVSLENNSKKYYKLSGKNLWNNENIEIYIIISELLNYDFQNINNLLKEKTSKINGIEAYYNSNIYTVNLINKPNDELFEKYYITLDNSIRQDLDILAYSIYNERDSKKKMWLILKNNSEKNIKGLEIKVTLFDKNKNKIPWMVFPYIEKLALSNYFDLIKKNECGIIIGPWDILFNNNAVYFEPKIANIYFEDGSSIELNN